MRWKALLVLAMALVLVASGCIGGGTTQTATPTSQSVQSQTKTQTSSSQAQTSTGSENVFDPLKAIEGIWSFAYIENASVAMNVTMSVKNMTEQATSISMQITEEGYIDLRDRTAQINMTTTTFPDNVTVRLQRTVINNTEYLLIPEGCVKKGNGSYVWTTNPVAIAKWLVQNEKPIAEYRENESVVLVYSAESDLIMPLAELYFTTPGMNLTVLDATVKLVFKNGELAREELVYSVRATAVTKDSLLGEIHIEQNGVWKGTIRITSINEKRKVKPPST